MTIQKNTSLEQYFTTFRRNIIGIDQEFVSPFGRKKNYLCRLDSKWQDV